MITTKLGESGYHPPPPPSQASPGFLPPNFSYPPPPKQIPLTTVYPPPRPPSSVSAVSSSVNGPVYSENIAMASMPTSPESTGRYDQGPNGAPAAGEFQGAASTTQDDVGTFNGGSYRISHRSTNSVLTLHLAEKYPLTAKPGKPHTRPHAAHGHSSCPDSITTELIICLRNHDWNGSRHDTGR